MDRLPKHRPPTHPGEMLAEEFLKPLAITTTELARHLDISYSRLNKIIQGRSPVTPDTALRLSQVLGMSADFWLGLQQDWDLWQAMHRPEARAYLPAEASSCGCGCCWGCGWGCEEYSCITAAERKLSLLTEAVPVLILADEQPTFAAG